MREFKQATMRYQNTGYLRCLHVAYYLETFLDVPSRDFLCRNVAEGHVTSRQVAARHFTSRHVTSRHVTSRHVTSRHFTSRHVKSRHFTLRHGTSLHATAPRLTLATLCSRTLSCCSIISSSHMS